MKVPRKYGLLRLIAFVLKFLAWIILLAAIAGVVGGLMFLRSSQQEWVRMVSLVGLITLPAIGIVWFVQLFAFGSIMTLLIDVEQNTRALAAAPNAPPLPPPTA